MPYQKPKKSYPIEEIAKIDLAEDCILEHLSKDNQIQNFSCIIEDLNDFFCNDALNYQDQLLGDTYFFRKNDSSEIVCAFTISNDSLNIKSLPSSRKNKVKKKFPMAKQMKSYPAVLIGRLGVDKKFKGNNIGNQLMNFIKSYCLIYFENKSRFIIVDSYNSEKPMKYYQDNNFEFLFSTEQQERFFYEINDEDELKTRFMFFDLMHWKKLNSI